MKLFTPLFLTAMLSASLCVTPAVAQDKPTPNTEQTQAKPQPKPNTTAPKAALARVPAPPPPAVKGEAWLLMDDSTGQIIAGHNYEAVLEPASITKVMTSYVVSRALAEGRVSLDDQVNISENAWRSGGGGTDGSTSFLAVNSQKSLRDLLYGMIIQSGNDASIALAEHVAGSEAGFADLMNSEAKRLGLQQTHFVNSHGLSAEGHTMSALDIAKLSHALIHDFPEEYAIYKKKEMTLTGITQHNRNTLLWKDDSVDGIKTGHHSKAGYNLAASAKRGDMRLISVVMGSTNERQRANDSQALLQWGFRFFETVQLYEADRALTTAELFKGADDELSIGLASPLLMTIERGRYDDLKAEMDIIKPLIAPIAQGQEVGTLRVSLDGKLLLQQSLIAVKQVEEAGIASRLWDSARLWWSE